MPLPFLLGADGKTCLILLKKRRAIAADQRDAVRASASRGSDGCRRVAAQVFATACAELASPSRSGSAYIFWAAFSAQSAAQAIIVK